MNIDALFLIIFLIAAFIATYPISVLWAISTLMLSGAIMVILWPLSHFHLIEITPLDCFVLSGCIIGTLCVCAALRVEIECMQHEKKYRASKKDPEGDADKTILSQGYECRWDCCTVRLAAA